MFRSIDELVVINGMVCYEGIQLVSVEVMSDLGMFTGLNPLLELQSIYKSSSQYIRDEKIKIILE